MATRRRVKRRHRRLWTETDLGGAERFRLDGRPDPRLHGLVLIGLSAQWNGPPGPGPCRFCHGAKLRPREYCLGCDSAGRIAQAAKPTRAVLTRTPQNEPGRLDDGSDVERPAKPKAVGLKGGTDGLRRKGA